MARWSSVREKEARFLSKISSGLPMAMLFGLPIILSLIAVYYLSPDWYAKLSPAASGVLSTLVIAVIIIILFFSYFRMHFLWEQNEQLYQELMARQKNENNPDPA